MRGVEALRERAELVVDRDAQRLEHERRGIVAAPAADPRLADHAQQVGRAVRSGARSRAATSARASRRAPGRSA